MINRTIRKIINVPLLILRKIKYYTLRSSLPVNINFIVSINYVFPFAYIRFFELGVWFYKSFSWPEYKKKSIVNNLFEFKQNKLIKYKDVIENLHNYNHENILFQTYIKTDNYEKISNIVSILLFNEKNSLISIDFMNEYVPKPIYSLTENKRIPVNHFSYNQLSTLPLSCYRDINLFLKRIPYHSFLVIINLPAEVKIDFSLLSKNLASDSMFLINNLNHIVSKTISSQNIINFDRHGFSLSEKIVICQHADFYFGVYDSLALGAFDSNSKGIIYLPENELDYFEKENENFNLEKLDKIASVKDIEEDIIDFLKMNVNSERAY